MKNHSPAGLEVRLRLHDLPELGPMRFLHLTEAFDSVSSVFAMPAGAWHTLRVPIEVATTRRSPTVREAAGKAPHWLEGPRRHLLVWDDPGCPALPVEVTGASPLPYVEGAPETLGRPQLVTVGSRRASPTGLSTAWGFARNPAQGDFTITNGLAPEIDSVTHEGTLEASGATVAVPGTDLRRLHPRHREALV